MERNEIDVDLAYLKINEQNNIKQPSISVSKRVLELESNQSPVGTSPEDEDMEAPRRSLRKKIRVSTESERRSFVKPQKSSDNSMKAIKKFYFDKSLKKLHPTLETIFEEPHTESVMSTRKFKRSIEFTANKDQLKTKRRKMKAKKVCEVRNLKKKVTMDFLMQKLSAIEDK